jgi:hypothetical protein
MGFMGKMGGMGRMGRMGVYDPMIPITHMIPILSAFDAQGAHASCVRGGRIGG